MGLSLSGPPERLCGTCLRVVLPPKWLNYSIYAPAAFVIGRGLFPGLQILQPFSWVLFRIQSYLCNRKYRAYSRKWCVQRVYRKTTHFIATSSNPDRSRRAQTCWSHETLGHIVLSVLQGPWSRNGPTVYSLKVTDGKGKVRKSSVPWGPENLASGLKV